MNTLDFDTAINNLAIMPESQLFTSFALFTRHLIHLALYVTTIGMAASLLALCVAWLHLLSFMMFIFPFAAHLLKNILEMDFYEPHAIDFATPMPASPPAAEESVSRGSHLEYADDHHRNSNGQEKTHAERLAEIQEAIEAQSGEESEEFLDEEQVAAKRTTQGRRLTQEFSARKDNDERLGWDYKDFELYGSNEPVFVPLQDSSDEEDESGSEGGSGVSDGPVELQQPEMGGEGVELQVGTDQPGMGVEDLRITVQQAKEKREVIRIRLLGRFTPLDDMLFRNATVAYMETRQKMMESGQVNEEDRERFPVLSDDYEATA